MTLPDLLAAMTRRGTPLAAETGLFLALQTADAIRDVPLGVRDEDVRVTAEGDVVIAPLAARASEPEAIASVLALIERHVVPLPASVRGLLTRAEAGSVASLSSLCVELEALLVPLNRAAARRVLGRLARDAERRPEGTRSAPASATDTVVDGGLRDGSALAASGAADVTVRSPPPPPLIDSSASLPVIPPPPRLGSLAQLALKVSSAVDTEPEGPTTASAATVPPGHALATTPDEDAPADELRADDTVPDGDAAPVPSSYRLTLVVIAALLGLVAVAVVLRLAT